MLLFQKRFHQGLLDGSVSLTFRRWQKPQVKPGGRYRCHPIGVLEVSGIDRVAVRDIKAVEARRAGFASREELLEYLGSGPAGPIASDTEVYRIALHHGGDGDRVSLALEDDLTDDDVAAIDQKLARMDRERPWTAATLAIIETQPRIAASRLAAELRRETAPFKVDVRKLKRLGLTQSFEVGYEISPRGRAYLARTTRKAKKRAAPRKRKKPPGRPGG